MTIGKVSFFKSWSNWRHAPSLWRASLWPTMYPRHQSQSPERHFFQSLVKLLFYFCEEIPCPRQLMKEFKLRTHDFRGLESLWPWWQKAWQQASSHGSGAVAESLHVETTTIKQRNHLSQAFDISKPPLSSCHQWPISSNKFIPPNASQSSSINWGADIQTLPM